LTEAFFYAQTKEIKQISLMATFLTTQETTVAKYFSTHAALTGFWQVPEGNISAHSLFTLGDTAPQTAIWVVFGSHSDPPENETHF